MQSIPLPQLEPTSHPWGRVARLCALVMGVGLVVLAKLPLCPFAALTHTPCPGCGMTRATLAIASGDVHDAWQLHPFAFVVSPIVALALGMLAWSYVRSGHSALPPALARPFLITLGALFVAMLGFWVARFFGLHGGPVHV